MNPTEVLLLGAKNRVAAISRLDGQIIWSTTLGGGMNTGFVSLASDDVHVFAYASGHLHCLDFTDGRILWTNELSGYGYGLANLTLPGVPSTTHATAAQYFINAAAPSTATAQ